MQFQRFTASKKGKTGVEGTGQPMPTCAHFKKSTGSVESLASKIRKDSETGLCRGAPRRAIHSTRAAFERQCYPSGRWIILSCIQLFYCLHSFISNVKWCVS